MDKRELRERYRQREVVGGVYAIKNTVLDKWFVDSTPNIGAARNRFSFFGDANLKIKADFTAQNGQGFDFVVLEELTKGETQTDAEFKADLAVLKDMWLGKLEGQEIY